MFLVPTGNCIAVTSIRKPTDFSEIFRLTIPAHKDLLEFLRLVRRKFKYLDVESISRLDLVNACFKKMQMVMKRDSNDQWPKTAKDMMSLRMVQAPSIQKLIGNATVDERSLMLKNVKRFMMSKLLGCWSGRYAVKI